MEDYERSQKDMRLNESWTEKYQEEDGDTCPTGVEVSEEGGIMIIAASKNRGSV